MTTIIGLDPTSGPFDRTDDHVFPPRPASLDGAVVALVANGLGEGELFLDALYDEMAKLSSLQAPLKVVKRSVSIPPDPQDWRRLTEEATVAVTGFGG
ncbi:MAG: hypothetical protein OXF64_09040 [bacterium]|nr:hypothetical protein [bacterium]MCY4194189.1 hypothetical protein [bacterium]